MQALPLAKSNCGLTAWKLPPSHWMSEKTRFLSAIEAVEDTVANLTSDSSITTDIGGAVVALAETLLSSEQIEELGETVSLVLVRGFDRREGPK